MPPEGAAARPERLHAAIVSEYAVRHGVPPLASDEVVAFVKKLLQERGVAVRRTAAKSSLARYGTGSSFHAELDGDTAGKTSFSGKPSFSGSARVGMATST